MDRLGVITDLGHPWLTVVATLAFGTVHAAVSQLWSVAAIERPS